MCDGFKMAGPKANMKARWRLIREGVKDEEPGKAGTYLGCDRIQSEKWLAPESGPMA